MKNKFLAILLSVMTVFNVVSVGAEDKDVILILVNESNPLSYTYAPKETINVSNYIPSYNNVIMQKEAGEKLIEMFTAMRADGIINLKAQSGYRSYDTQKVLNNQKVKEYQQRGYKDAYDLAKTVVALPGSSEHQTGLAIDVSVNGTLTASFANTSAGKWLQQNAHNYGYILRYAAEKKSITNIIYEPWHYRYVGQRHAQVMYEQGWCLEEYMEYMLTEQQKDEEQSYEDVDSNSFITYKEFMGLLNISVTYDGGYLQRQKAMSLLEKTLDIEGPAPIYFADNIYINREYYKAIQRLALVGVVAADANNMIWPADYMTWGEALEMIDKAEKL